MLWLNDRYICDKVHACLCVAVSVVAAMVMSGRSGDLATHHALASSKQLTSPSAHTFTNN